MKRALEKEGDDGKSKSYFSGAQYCRTSLAFMLMPQSNAILDCSSITAAGHVIPHSYAPISVSQFMDDLCAEEDALCNHTEDTYVSLFLGGSSFAKRSILLNIE